MITNGAPFAESTLELLEADKRDTDRDLSPQRDIARTAGRLVWVARNAVDPHAEAVAIVNGLWRGERHPYAQALIAAIEELRS